ncbi:MAG: methylenetetrahydrofolate reductase C-terminal domain-containing protein [Anaerolineae bacterium]|nr:methylenetetrahydrofolate reductase C-terminal domain-containing protein [Anaerolineae bacterium]
MPGFTPGRRWQPAYYPFHNDSIMERFLAAVERTSKGLLFGCRMCGNCMLQETAFICSMECPKGLRNGPCGGSTPEHCYVDESRPCIWYKIYERAEKLGTTHKLLEVLPPLDWDKVGTEIWKDVLNHWNEVGGLDATWRALKAAPEERDRAWEQFFYEIRQPDWWQGDAKAHLPPQPHEPVSHLESLLVAGQFAVTAEIAPPLAAAPDDVIKKVNLLKPFVDAVNFTDNPSATPRMSSLACSLLALQNGLEPVMQIAARDRTRMGVQAEVLGASALGIRNILCLTGDHPRLGPPPHGRMDVWDIDSIQMVWILRRMRDDCHFLDERELKCGPSLFIGAAGSPYASTDRFQALREEKKVNAGAQFLQTNLVYDLDRFEAYLAELDKRGVLARTSVMAGITPVRSVKAAHAMNEVPGVTIPPALIKRLENASDPKEEGLQITLEIIERVKRLPGVKGIHFMAVGWESIVPRLVTEAGLQRPSA